MEPKTFDCVAESRAWKAQLDKDLALLNSAEEVHAYLHQLVEENAEKLNLKLRVKTKT